MVKNYDLDDIVSRVLAGYDKNRKPEGNAQIKFNAGMETPELKQSRKYYERRCGRGAYTQMDAYKPLLEPITIGGVQIKNRFVMPAMGTNYADQNGSVTDQMINYYTARAKGGFGLIVLEVTAVHPSGKAIVREAGLWKDDFILGYKKLIDKCHTEGAKVFVQLHHAGRQSTPETNGGYEVVSPSPISCSLNRTLPRELATEEVYELIDLFGDAARRATAAGADGVELNGAHGYIIAQFMSAYSNKRIDEFGGDFRGRMRFATEIVRNIKEKCGSGFPVQFRFSGSDYVDGGRNAMEAQMVAKHMESCGCSSISISGGTYSTLEWMSAPPSMPQGYNTDMSALIKKAVSIPVIVAGRIVDPETAKIIIEQGKADLVALGRTSGADPEFPNKVAVNQTCDIIHCISCLEGCLKGIFTGGPFLCVANPRTGREGEVDMSLADKPKKVLIAGAGPAGLTAAYLAAQRGHDVVVYEKKSAAGGQFRLAAVPPTKQDIATLLRSYLNLCDKYGVEIRYNTEFDISEVDKEGADAVVLATGGEPLIPGITGIHNPLFKNAVDVLDGKEYFGQKVLVVGGGLVGAETADYISDQGADVSVIEFKPSIAGDVFLYVRDHLMARLNKKNVQMYPGAKVTEFFDDGVSYEDISSGEKRELKGFDTVVLAMGAKSYNPYEEQLKNKKDIQLFVIGDARKAGKAMSGIQQAYNIQKEI
jgi:2,4-dienoyl-CoA reductase-like NADH-dependent reductase (Old Yellow Enzyme family)/thioredoxin reductase